jgi:hypothetical protein
LTAERPENAEKGEIVCKGEGYKNGKNGRQPQRNKRAQRKANG